MDLATVIGSWTTCDRCDHPIEAIAGAPDLCDDCADWRNDPRYLDGLTLDEEFHDTARVIAYALERSPR